MMTLLHHWSSGLTHLHKRGIIHCDISAKNLVIVQTSPPRGLLIDFDAAVEGRSHDDYEGGTLPFLAQELLPIPTKPASGLRYASGIEVLALGLNVLALYRNEHFSWDRYGPSSRADDFFKDTVDELRWDRLMTELNKCKAEKKQLSDPAEFRLLSPHRPHAKMGSIHAHSSWRSCSRREEMAVPKAAGQAHKHGDHATFPEARIVERDSARRLRKREPSLPVSFGQRRREGFQKTR